MERYCLARYGYTDTPPAAYPALADTLTTYPHTILLSHNNVRGNSPRLVQMTVQVLGFFERTAASLQILLVVLAVDLRGAPPLPRPAGEAAEPPEEAGPPRRGLLWALRGESAGLQEIEDTPEVTADLGDRVAAAPRLGREDLREIDG